MLVTVLNCPATASNLIHVLRTAEITILIVHWNTGNYRHRLFWCNDITVNIVQYFCYSQNLGVYWTQPECAQIPRRSVSPDPRATLYNNVVVSPRGEFMCTGDKADSRVPGETGKFTVSILLGNIFDPVESCLSGAKIMCRPSGLSGHCISNGPNFRTNSNLY